jgi:hypothetical protein
MTLKEQIDGMATLMVALKKQAEMSDGIIMDPEAVTAITAQTLEFLLAIQPPVKK